MTKKYCCVIATWMAVTILAWANTCELYPIGVAQRELAQARSGDIITLRLKPAGSCNASWLSWSGGQSEPELARSLSASDNARYSNPLRANDYDISGGDWIIARPGVVNSREVRAALGRLKQLPITLPVYDRIEVIAGRECRRVCAFASFQLLNFDLAPEHRLTARFLGYVLCDRPPNTAPRVDAGPDQTVYLPSLASLSGSMSDDGLPAGSVLLTRWRQLSGPAPVTLQNAAALATTVSFAQSGVYQLELTASDSELTSSDTVTITVIQPNRAPVVIDQNISTLEDKPAEITLTATDPDGDPVSFQIVDQPANGVLSGRGALWIYTPKTNYNGIDRFTFKATDGNAESALATIFIHITPVNDPPEAIPARVVTDEDMPLVIVLSATDVDSEALAFQIISPPSHGTLSLLGNRATYQPDTNFNGSDEFRFSANDGLADSSPALVSILVRPVNDRPVAIPQSVVLDEDILTAITLSASDADGDVLSFRIDIPPAHGILKGVLPTVSYQPDTNYFGADEFTFSVRDEFLESLPAKITLTVRPVNDPPTAGAGNPQLINLASTATLSGVAGDIDSTELRLQWTQTSGPSPAFIAAPAHATTEVSFLTGGIYVFRFSVIDGEFTSFSETTVTVNRPPVVDAGADQKITFPNKAFLSGTAQDDGIPANIVPTFAWSKLSGPGIAAFSAPDNLSTTVRFSAPGTYHLRLSASDGLAGSFADTMVTVDPTNRPPSITLGPEAVVRLPDALALYPDVTDDHLPAGVPLTYRWIQIAGPAPAHFSVLNAPDPSVTFPTNGDYTVKLLVGDSEFETSAELHILVLPALINSPPVINLPTNLVLGLTNRLLLSATVQDDGLPAKGSMHLRWESLSGPGSVEFDNPANATTWATFDLKGNYAIQLAADDGELINRVVVTVSVCPDNQPPVVDAGPDRTLLLPRLVPNLGSNAISLTPISTGFNNPIGLGYYPPANRMLMSVNYPDGLPYNFELVDETGARTALPGVAGVHDEVYFAIAPDEGGGSSRGGFPAGDVFTGNNQPGEVVRIPASGEPPLNPWLTLPGEKGQLNGALHFDETGVFGGDLIIASSLGNIWRVNAAGNARLLASIGALIEGLTVLPNEPVRYGPWAGKILAGGEETGLLYAIDAQGNISNFNLGIFPESIHVIPPNQNFYGVDFASRILWGAPAAAFANIVGDVLIAQEHPGILWRVQWDGKSFVTSRLAQVTQWEGVSFAPQGILEIPSPEIFTLQGHVSDDGLPTGSRLSVNWEKVAGPGTVTFGNSNSAMTSASFSEPGDYILRLTANDSAATAADEVAVTVRRNQPPQVSAGSNKTIRFPEKVTLAGSVTDDGLPDPTFLALAWTLATGPGPVRFSQPSYNAARDFSTSHNPNGPWSYGWSSNKFADFQTYTEGKTGDAGLNKWFLTGGYPLVYQNPGNGPVPIGNLFLAPDRLFIHPGPLRQYSVVRWTAPEVGDYLVQGVFAGLDRTVTTDASILINGGSQPFSGYLNGKDSQLPFSFTRHLNASDTIDFMVGPGENGTFDFDGTTLSATVTRLAGAITEATFSLPGTYTLRLTANDSEFTDSSETVVTVQPVCREAPPGLVARWSGDNNYESINHNHAVLLQGAAIAPGFISGAFNFDGIDDAIKTPALPPAAYEVGDGLSIECWINPADISPIHPILEWNNTQLGGVHFWIYPSPGFLFANLVDTAGNGHPINTSYAVLTSNTFQHVALTYDKKTGIGRLYCNGAAVAEQNLGLFTPQTSFPLYIGARPGSRFFKGLIDEVGIYNRALDPSEISALNGAQSAGKCLPPSPLGRMFLATEDFNARTNPAGPWSYGFKKTPTSPLTPFESTNADSVINVWTPPGAGYPRLAFNKTGRQATIFGAISFPPDELLLHPGPKGEFSCLRWIAPASATYRIRGVFEGLETTTTDVHVQLNGLDLFAEAISGRLDTKPFTLIRSMVAGEILDFTVGVGSNGTFDYDSTGLRLWIEEVILPEANNAPIVSAGPDQTVSLGQALTLAGSVWDDGWPLNSTVSVGWTQISGPAPATFQNSRSAATPVTFSQAGIYRMRLSASDGDKVSSDDLVIKVLSAGAINQRPVVNVGNARDINQRTCTLDGLVSDDGLPANGLLSAAWSKLSGPGSVDLKDNLLAPDPSDPATLHALSTATFSSGGQYVMRLIVCDGQLITTNDLSLTVHLNHRPVVFAGIDKIYSPNAQVFLQGTVEDDGLPAGQSTSIKWSQISGPALATFDQSNALSTPVACPALGRYVFRLSASDSELLGSDDVMVTISAAPNQPPLVRGQAPPVAALPTSVELVTQVQDDGLPSSSLEVAWSKLSGPGAVTFFSINGQYQAVFTTPGSYILRLFASDGERSSTSDVPITVTASNAPPLVFAGGPQHLVLPSAGQLNGNITDDGIPGPVRSDWLQVAGPAPANIQNTHSPFSPVYFSQPGTYRFRLTANDGLAVSAAETEVTVYPSGTTNTSPTVKAGAGQTIRLPQSSVQLRGSASDDGLPNNSILNVSWSVVAAPGHVSFSEPSSLSSSATFALPGTYVLRLAATDGERASFDDCVIKVFTPVEGPPPSIAIFAPHDGDVLTSPSNIIASVSSGEWTLAYRAAEGGESSEWTTFGAGQGPVDQAALTAFDPTLLLNGIYHIRLMAIDSSGQSTAAILSVIVDGRLKIGQFSLTFLDLDLPLAGIPIRITRTYDSRDRRLGDFGYGWRLGINSVTLTKSRDLGSGWMQSSSGSGFTSYCLDSVQPRIVTIRFPNDKVYKFRAQLSPQCQLGYPIASVRLNFVPLGDTLGTLECLTGNEAQIDGYVGSVNLVDISDFSTFEPHLFRFTTPEGDVHVIDDARGLQQVIDRNGNSLVVTPEGFFHSSGKAVRIERNANGFITRVTDPATNSLTYNYDAGGHLASSSDRDQNTTLFRYAGPLLTQVIDPRGVQAVRNEFDDLGRLIRQIDAHNHTNTFSHAIEARAESITDRLGYTTTYFYDLRGNIVQMVDPRGATSTLSYDTRDNLVAAVDPLGRTHRFTYDDRNNRTSSTDRQGFTTLFSYDARRRLTRIEDPYGHIVSNTYDANGNLVRMEDALGNVTSLCYERGLPSHITNALGCVTTFAYDSAGQLSNRVDSLGHGTTYKRDENNRVIEQTGTRSTTLGVESVTTSFHYDRSGRLIDVFAPDGSLTRRIYDSAGNLTAEIDAAGLVSSYIYDELGQIIQRIHPDKSVSNYEYDAEGHFVALINPLGQKTQFTIDPVGQVVGISRPDGTSLSNVFNLGGQLTAQIDALQNVTFFGYDPGGRLNAVTNALGAYTLAEHDANGNLIATHDLLGRIDRYSYDPLNRPTSHTFPDGSSVQTIWDALDRAVARVNAAGQTNYFEYDGRDRLTGVIDALNARSSYRYDEFDNLVEQTDANGHVTTYGYDNMGRRTRRTLPGGQSETFSYDALSRLTNRLDFAGYNTAYSYDAMSRLTAKLPDARLRDAPVFYHYNALGLRTTMQDAHGTTTYFYSDLNRLLEKGTPHGVLRYAYDSNGNLTLLSSGNRNGSSMAYTYDALNRLDSATDARLGTTRYGYDAAGNVTSVLAPNGLRQVNTYDPLNRLTNLTFSLGSGFLNSFSYRLDLLGNRSVVTESNGRESAYGYNGVQRLTAETNRYPGGLSSAKYDYDPVGNRTNFQETAGAQVTTRFDLNDGILSDQYDANGNTISGIDGRNVRVQDEYDFENRLRSRNNGEVELVYDGDGHRVGKTVRGVPRWFLIDDLNPTGYAETLEELSLGSSGEAEVSRVFNYGLERISIDQVVSNQWEASFYSHDGHGDVRFLTDLTGRITDTYGFDAFGQLASRSGVSRNEFLYGGQEFDLDLGLYYLRARYYNPASGRFWTRDPFEGSLADPSTLHGYIYGRNNPVNRLDPSGYYDLASVSLGVAIGNNLHVQYDATVESIGWGLISTLDGVSQGKSDEAILLDYEISTLTGAAIGYALNRLINLSWRQLFADLSSPRQLINETRRRLNANVLEARELLRQRFGNRPPVPFQTTKLSDSGSSGTGTQLEFGFAASLGRKPSAPFPPNDGFIQQGPATVLPGTRVDRYGSDFGTFVAPQGTPFQGRSIPAEFANKPYSVFEVARPFTVDAGPAAPAFGFDGLSTQFKLPTTVDALLKDGFLREISRVP